MSASVIACLVFILTHSVVAQADFAPTSEFSARLPATGWAATHVGTAQIGELAVSATFEESQHRYEVPASLANRLNTLISIEPVTKKSFRLHLVAGELQAVYELNSELLTGENAFRDGFVSVPAINHEYSFVIIPLDGGALRVVCQHQGKAGTVSEFSLDPVGL